MTWFEQFGMGSGAFAVAEKLARARGISVDSVKHTGIIAAQAGKVRLRKRAELVPSWSPTQDAHLTIWKCLH